MLEKLGCPLVLAMYLLFPTDVLLTAVATWGGLNIVVPVVFRWVGVRSFRERIQPAAVIVLCGMIFGIMLYLFRQISLGSGVLR